MNKGLIRRAKRGIVIALEDVCGLTGHHLCHRLATTSAKLDARWGTQVWSCPDDPQVDREN